MSVLVYDLFSGVYKLTNVLLLVILKVGTCVARFGDPYNYVVTALKRVNGDVWCHGGVISAFSAITACRCVGRFVAPEMFDFVLVDRSGLFLKTHKGQDYDLAKVFVHRHCTPTSWEYMANDLGGWKIQGRFDSPTTMILQPVFWEKNASYVDTMGHNRKRCFIFGTWNYRARAYKVKNRKNQLACFDKACKELNLTTTCLSFQSEALNGKEICAEKNPREKLFSGSPIFCKGSDTTERYIVYGVVGYESLNFMFWTRLDTYESEGFYLETMRGRADRLVNIRAVLVILLFKHTILMFQ